MRKVKLNTDLQYSQFLRWYFICLVVFLSAMTSILVSMFVLKNEDKDKLNQVQYLRSDLNALNENINSQIRDGYLNIHAIFLDFGDFQDKTVDFIGLEDLTLLDSLSKVGSVVKYFDLEPNQKHHLEIIHYLDIMDDLLLHADKETINFSEENLKREVDSDFKTKWSKTIHLLDRAFLQSEKDLEIGIDLSKKKIYIFCLVFILVLLAFILVLFFLFNFRFLGGLKFISENVKLLLDGETPRKNSKLLSGELYNIQKGLLRLHHDFTQTDRILELFYSDARITDQEMNVYKSNIFFNSINKLRLQLTSLEDNEKIRNWDLNGVSQLTDITNKFSGEPKKLYDQFLICLVKYVDAVQGGIFVKETESMMVLEASYAYDRIKKKNRVVNYGESLLGEVWSEEKIQYLENIPEDHFFVKSALGESKPVSLMILPLMDRGECYGVLEIAVFSKLLPYKQDFLAKAAEILASSTANVKVNLKTKQLLRESQILTERFRQQEEEQLEKISKLNIQLEQERKVLFAKDREIKSYRLELDLAKTTRQKLSKELSEKDLQFQKEVQSMVSNSKELQDLNSELAKLKAEILDLQETVHIRNLKIERMRKKIENEK